MEVETSTIPTLNELFVPSRGRLADRFTAFDFGILSLMPLISGAIGVYWAFSEGGKASVRRLLTGDGSVSALAASLSIVGTYVSAGFILGITANIYDCGTMYFAIVGSYGLTIYLTSTFFIPVFHDLKLLTCFQYLGMRFDPKVRRVAVYLYIIQMLSFLAMSLLGPAQALSQVTGVSEWTAILTIGLVCTLYTSIGGIKAVVYTDCFQCVAFLLSIFVIVALGFFEVGSVSEVFDIANEGSRIVYDEIDATVSHSFWALIFGAGVTNLTSYATNQMMVARYLTVSSVKRAQTAAWMSWPLLTIVMVLGSLSGLLAYAKYAGCDPLTTAQIKTSDQVLPYFVMDVLGEYRGTPGIFALGIFAASLSSVSSGVNSLASVAYVDLIADGWPKLSEQTASRLMVLFGVIFGFMSIALVALLDGFGNSLEVTVAINSGIGATILGLFVAGIFLPRADSTSALIGTFFVTVLSFVMHMGVVLRQAQPLPRSISNCEGFQWNSTVPLPTPKLQPQHLEDVSFAFGISHLWYPAISLIFQLMVSYSCSLIRGNNGSGAVKPVVKNTEESEPIDGIA